jgi:hypothetical protein
MYAKECLILATLCLLAVAGCGPIEANNGNNGGGNNGGEVTEVPPGALTEDATWSGTVILTGDYVIESTLTIEPCTTVRVFGRLTVRRGGVLMAQGEEDCPITFTSTDDNPSPGDWRWIDITRDAGNGSTFEWVVVEYTGAANEYAIGLSGKTVTMNNVTVRNGIGRGIIFGNESSDSSLDNLTFENMTGVLIEAHWNNIGQIGSVSASGGDEDRIAIVGTLLDTPLTLDKKGVPYVHPGSQSVGADLTIDPGVQLLMAPGARLIVENEGSITANGTEDAPVVIQSSEANPAPGDWRTIRMEGGPNTFTWTEIRHAQSALYQNADVAITLNDSTFEQNECDYTVFSANTEDKWTFNNTPAERCQ